MPASKQAFTLWNDAVFTKVDAGVNGNGSFTLATSAEQNNALGAYKSLKLILEYMSVTPEFGAVPQTFDIDAIVEGKSADGTRWFPVAYQYNSYRNSMSGKMRVIQLQPAITGFDAGIDDDIYFGGQPQARVSRQQGNLPDTSFRVRLVVTETDFGGPGSFESLTISGYGEAFDA